ncbi:MAG: aminopeptidase P family protein [candidate division Zixibacteria bacterium]|nr:aminopeptidase P family protein [candidate division Zixibacteria bacterium]
MNTKIYAARRRRLALKLKKENLDAFVATAPHHLRYLFGFSGSNGLGLIANGDGSRFFTDSRYAEQIKREVKGVKTEVVSGTLLNGLKEVPFFRRPRRRVGLDAKSTTVKMLDLCSAAIRGALWEKTENLVETLLAVKDAGELARIKKAVEIADITFEEILPAIRPGVREADVAAEIEYRLKRNGADEPAFGTIVASGFRSAMPHGRASEKRIGRGEFVTLDFGAFYSGYCSDITRTVVMGKASSRQKKVYGVVLRAQRRGIEALRPGVKGREVDGKVREVIRRAGLGKYFGHGTGHGIGLLVHDFPGVGQTSEDILKTGMVVTIEPGVYIPGWGGVRIEDDVYVGPHRGAVLNRAPKELLEL